MDINIIFNNESLEGQGLLNGWGLSFLIDQHILFDTGEKAESLFNNMHKLRVNLSAIDTVVISHEHWDHIGGLKQLLEERKGISVYVCPGFSEEFKREIKDLGGKLKEVAKLTEISKYIFTTGEIAGIYKENYIAEQTLVIKTVTGLVVVTGCAHPGILNILNIVQSEFAEEKIYLVLGGFHLKDDLAKDIKKIVVNFQSRDIEKVGPMHCSGEQAQQIFKEKYQNNCFSLKAGQTIKI